MSKARGTGTTTKTGGTEPKPVLRCDLLPHAMNRGKEEAVLRTLARWRAVAAQEAASQWRAFFEGEPFSKTRDKAAGQRKATEAARGALVSVIARRGERDLPPAKAKLTKKQREKLGVAKEPRRIIPLAPGFVDPMADAKARLGTQRVQMVRHQVVGMLTSWLSNRQNDFRDAVTGSSLDEVTRHMLHTVNRAEAWFELERPVSLRSKDDADKVTETVIPAAVRKLARVIMRHVFARHRKPSMSRIDMVVDQRGVLIQPATKSKAFRLWLDLSTTDRVPGRQTDFRRVAVPLKPYAYFEARRGQRRPTVQVSQDRETGRLTFGIVTDIRPAIAARQADPATAYVPQVDAIDLDFGLKALFATNEGDLLGRGFLARLKRYDALLTTLAQHIQRSGGRPRDSRRYRATVTALRGFVRTEVNRVLNRLVARRKPGHLVLERLRFSSLELSKRLNRIIQNCGRAMIRAKLTALEQEYGVTSEEVNPAYTSQTCSGCGYVDRRNRREQARFRCLWCGAKMHADVNAGRVIGSRRSLSETSPFGRTKAAALAELVRRFCERWPQYRSPPPATGRTGRRDSPADPRWTNPYFGTWAIAARSSQAVREPA